MPAPDLSATGARASDALASETAATEPGAAETGGASGTGAADRSVTDRPIAGGPIAGRPIAGGTIADRPIADRPIADRPIAGRPREDRPREDRAAAEAATANAPARALRAAGSAEGAQRGRVVAVIGATGAVGGEMLGCLERSSSPIASVRAFASPRSVGKFVRFRGGDVRVEALTDDAFAGVDIALFASSSAVSKRYAPAAIGHGAVVIDNSSAFRMDDAVPLVVPEVNGEALRGGPALVANPNCVAALMVMALWPLHALAPVRRVIASTYQAASGAGAAAMVELEDATRAYLDGASYTHTVLPHPYAFNLFSHNTAIDPATGYNGEETKVMREVRKIMAIPDLAIAVTCVRVPVLRAHAIALNVEFDAALDIDAMRGALAAAPGVRLVDDREANHFPMPNEASRRDEVLVGRLRVDLSDPSGRTIALFLSGDQLLKGAALNAVQIAERLV